MACIEQRVLILYLYLVATNFSYNHKSTVVALFVPSSLNWLSKLSIASNKLANLLQLIADIKVRDLRIGKEDTSLSLRYKQAQKGV
jgi:hypothetical protein